MEPWQKRFKKVESVFQVLPSGELIRTVISSTGGSYSQSCTKEVYDAVAAEISLLGAAGTTGTAIAERLDAPYTQVAVAVDFMKERGCIEIGYHRKLYPSTNFVELDAMIEYFALKESPAETV